MVGVIYSDKTYNRHNFHRCVALWLICLFILFLLSAVIVPALLITYLACVMQGKPLANIEVTLSQLFDSITSRKIQKRNFCQKLEQNIDVVADNSECESRSIKSYICNGQCMSMFIPANLYGVTDCTMCSPATYKYIDVSLKCKTGIQKVTIPVVQECTCKKCNVELRVVMTNKLKEKKRLRQIRIRYKERIKAGWKNNSKSIKELKLELKQKMKRFKRRQLRKRLYKMKRKENKANIKKKLNKETL